MKKIIALAVASAFVAPAMAAEVTLSGTMEFAYVSPDSGSAYMTDDGDNMITIKATQELTNGMSISGDMNFDNSDSPNSDEGGESLTLSGAFGSITVGDDSSGTDKFDDVTDVAPLTDMGVGTTGDAGLSWDLPSLAAGLAVRVSHSPEGDNSAIGGGIDEDASAFGLRYTVGNVKVSLGQEEEGTTTTTMANISYKAGPLYLAYEMSDVDTGTTSTSDQNTGYAVTYKLDAITLGIATEEIETDGSGVDNDKVAYFAIYNLGSGVNAYVEMYEDKKTAGTDQTAFGLQFAF